MTDPREELRRTMERIYRYRMTTTSGGNISVRDPDGGIWITPARIDKGSLAKTDIVRVGEQRHDGVRPSSELPLHEEIYRRRPDVNAIVHAHPVALVAFSAVRETPDTRVLHQAWTICGTPGFASYALPGSALLGTSVSAVLGAGHDCAVLENHGVVTVGRDVAEAFRRFEALEFVAKTIVKARTLRGELRALDDDDLAAARSRASIPRAPRDEPPSTEELDGRDVLAEFVRRGYRQRLFISTNGTFSLRLGPDAFLITPHHVDRGRLGPAELILVRGGSSVGEGLPSHAAAVHDAIYRAHPEVQSIVNAAPVNATAFGLVGAIPDTRAIPESRVLLRTPQAVPFARAFSDPSVLAATVSPRAPAVLIPNSGALVVGGSVLEAFDRIEVLEATAEAIVSTAPLGALAPMSDAEVAELDAAFGR